ncbi:ornithine cyclodeaminase family protein [Candidatus Marinamargulisbacteria bacterium SCGC AG-343-D04]|nr:ornithine cyclodeaminase family protein [Candidatus Marinamargulisbacteria bacterium SCGC AG-343-D04]
MTVPFYSNQDIVDNISMKEAVELVEKAFCDYAQNKSKMPEKIYLNLPEFHGDFRAMPAYDSRYNIAGVKWVNSHAQNVKKNMASVSAMLLVNSPETGLPLAIVEASELTAIRTGAAGAVAVKYCTPKTAKSIAFVGAGVQARYQYECIREIRSIESVTIMDVHEATAQKLYTFIKEKDSCDVQICTDIEEATKDRDIIVTSTPVKSPILDKGHVGAHTHINAIGADAPGKQECSIDLIKSSQIIVDDTDQAMHSGDINTAVQDKVFLKQEILSTLGELLLDSSLIDVNQRSLFDSTGLAVQDMAMAGYFLEKIRG